MSSVLELLHTLVCILSEFRWRKSQWEETRSKCLVRRSGWTKASEKKPEASALSEDLAGLGKL